MRLVTLAWRYLWARPLCGTEPGVAALGVGAMSFVVVVSEQIERSVQRDRLVSTSSRAKGSPRS